MDVLKRQKTEYSYEVIFIDDGSKDETLNYLKKLVDGDSKFRYIKQDNGGISKARNSGIEDARGRYIAFIDHDDEISEDYIQVLLREAIEKMLKL